MWVKVVRDLAADVVEESFASCGLKLVGDDRRGTELLSVGAGRKSPPAVVTFEIQTW